MIFFDNQNFQFPQDLDLENKLFLPTSKLYAQLNGQLQTLYQDTRAALIDGHALMASSAKQLYEQPGPTLAAWYDQAASRATELHAQINEELLPKAQASYRQLVVDVADAGRETQLYLQNFMENPEAVAAAAIQPVAAYLAAASEATEAALVSGYYALASLLSQLMKQPAETLEASIHYLLSELLEFYFQAVSSLLIQI
ncbi:hypothetical protein [Methylobacter sp. YRD-M1]|uniref:hypothetical protein n=1 Tax=Methylobacter sp. YRD-M1 TaxID=2911520 RepID=UPI00227AB349|nr:hypothetical protein [Methylobacter sp. YRD-M1]WAK02116.1 hypothetical protein LZ558_20255 [Methylobacter sp. YRD-M1]